MGILVPEASLPNGISVSNVYMSFASEVTYVYPRNADGSRNITSNYRVFKDSTKTPNSEVKFPITVNVTDINVGVYYYLYEKLKQSYPDSVDIIDPVPEVVIPDVVAEIL